MAARAMCKGAIAFALVNIPVSLYAGAKEHALDEILPAAELELPPSGKKLSVTQKELDMATRLVKDMTEPWQPERFKDTYREDLLARTVSSSAAKKNAAKDAVRRTASVPRRKRA